MSNGSREPGRFSGSVMSSSPDSKVDQANREYRKPAEEQPGSSVGRRQFLRRAGTVLAATGVGAGLSSIAVTPAQAQQKQIPPGLPNAEDYVDLERISAPTEVGEHAPGPFAAPDQRVGFAIVGLGHLSIDQLLPALRAFQVLQTGSPGQQFH